MPSILITGGAGFIGVNAANHFAELGWTVTVLDNLSRKGTEKNLDWILGKHQNISFVNVDIRSFDCLNDIVSKVQPDMLLHLAAQVAVTTSYQNPRFDFEVNALGTFNILEAVRNSSMHTFVLYASTNKVYGGLEKIAVSLDNSGYRFTDFSSGIDEHQSLDFHSPYGCSKGVADQYVIDYARIYGLNTCSFRQSCIYGQRQFGIEDQGWVAWFTIAAVLNKPITIFGDGWQTRDVLHVNDLCLAYQLAWENREKVNGEAFNIGGGMTNTLCLRKLVSLLEAELDVPLDPRYDKTRPGDQPVFVCNIQKAERLMNWSPTISLNTGVTDLIDWVKDNKFLF